MPDTTAGVIVLTGEQVASHGLWRDGAGRDTPLVITFTLEPQPLILDDGTWQIGDATPMSPALAEDWYLSHWWQEQGNRNSTFCKHNGGGYPTCPACGPLPELPASVELRKPLDGDTDMASAFGPNLECAGPAMLAKAELVRVRKGVEGQPLHEEPEVYVRVEIQ